MTNSFGPRPRELVGEVKVDYVGFAGGGGRPRAVVLVEATLRGGRTAGQEGTLTALCQYWTLSVSDGLFTVLDIEDTGRGRYHLVEPIGAASMAVVES